MSVGKLLALGYRLLLYVISARHCDTVQLKINR